MPYETTSVMVSHTHEEIKALLAKFDVVATRFTSFPAFALLEFVRNTAAGPVSYRITVKPQIHRKARSPSEIDRAERQVWRVVYWWLKSKMEAIKFGLVEFEQEMLPYMLLRGADDKSATTAELFFEHLAGKLKPPQDPFGGMQIALPPGEEPP